jgi:hypothetical protein
LTTLCGSPGVSVANVRNGAGSFAVPAWTDVINRIQGSETIIVGYVATGYPGWIGIRIRLESTNVADWIAQIQRDISAWYGGSS